MTDQDSIVDHAPLRMRLRAAGWQLRLSLGDGKRREISLRTKNRKLAEQRARKIIAEFEATTLSEHWSAAVARGMEPRGWVRVLASNVKSRAKKHGGGLALGALEFLALRTEGRCEVSGIPFHMDGIARHPFGPSIDRIDSMLGYEVDNVRVVCLAVNLCMSSWGETVFNQIAAAVTVRRLEGMAAGAVYFPGRHVTRTEPRFAPPAAANTDYPGELERAS